MINVIYRMDSSLVFGEIDRISSAGNAMLEANNVLYNLGPLSDQVVGNKAIVVPLSGVWAVCATPFIERDQYLSDFSEASGHSKSKAKKLIKNINPLNESTKLTEGDLTEVQIKSSSYSGSYAMLDNGSIVEINFPFLPTGLEVAIEITDASYPILSAKISKSILKGAPKLGTELTVEILGTKGSTAYGLYKSIPVVLPSISITKLDYIHAGVVSHDENSITASIAALSESERLSVGDSFEFEFNKSLSSKSEYTVLSHEGCPVRVPIPEFPIKGKIPLTVTKVKSNTVSAEIDFTAWSLPELGTKLTVEVIKNSGSTAYGLYNSIPVILPSISTSKGDYIHAGISSHDKNGIKATIAALSENERLSVGDSFEFEFDEDISSKSGDTVLFHEGIPVQVPTPEFSIKRKVPLKVTNVESNMVSAEIDFTEWSGTEFEIGETVSINNIERHGEQLVGWNKGAPLTLPITKDPPIIPDMLDVVISDISSDRISASITDHSYIKPVRNGDTITIPIHDKQEDYLIGEYRGFPVWVPFNSKINPSELTVNVVHISHYGIFASLTDIIDNFSTTNSKIHHINIGDSDFTQILAEFKSDHNSDSVYVPVSFPLEMDINGEIGVEIVDKNDSSLIVILRTSNVGEEAEPISTFLLETQKALVALNNQSPTEAASAWEIAAKETSCELRKVDAKRSAAYGNIEDYLENENYEEATTVLKNIQHYLKKVDLPEHLLNNISDEIKAYEQLIKATQECAPDSVTDFQQIMYATNVRPHLDSAATIVPTSSEGLDKNWVPVFPHPFVVERIQKVSEQFDQIPSVAKNILDEFPRQAQANWSIAPEPPNEPRSAEKLGGAPNSLDSHTELDMSTNKKEGPISTSGQEKPEKDTVSQENAGQTVETNETTNELEKSSKEINNDNQLESDNLESNQVSGSLVSRGDDNTNNIVKNEDLNEFKSSKQLQKLRKKAEDAASDNPRRETSKATTGSNYQRAKPITNFVKARADGICEACGEAAPFQNKDGEPYLESHHVDELGKGGKDHPAKVVALCPTCHKRVHHWDKKEQFNQQLREKLESGLADVGTN